MPNFVNKEYLMMKKFQNYLKKAKSAIIFSPDCPMGEKISLKSKDKCIVMIAAPGNDMNVHNQNPPSDLTIFLNRANFQEKEEQYFLPEPLGDPNNEKFIKRSTAESYEVKAGEFIQIIDTGGRQCSDFLAFDTRKLNEGIVNIIDDKTTRTFMGSAYL